MLLEWKLTEWNPLLCKILMGMLGSGLLVFALFHQPWIPVEISAPETGVLVAMPAPVRSTANSSAFSPGQAQAVSRQQEPIAVPMIHLPDEAPPDSLEMPPILQTAEVPPIPSPPPSPFPVPTYAEHIAPLLEKHCAECHRVEQGGLTLNDASQAVDAASRIAQATKSRRMPPWKPKPGFGHFQQERRLTDEEIALIQHWVAAGTPLGHPAEHTTPSANSPPDPWRLGKPTVAYQLPKPFHIPVSETGLQWNFVIPTGVQRDLYLTAAELRPGNPSLVKRMVLAYDPTGTARRKDQPTAQPGFPASKSGLPIPSLVLGEWSPGMSAQPVPEGTAYQIPAGADLILTVEYAATEVPASDPWSMGLHLTRSAPKHLLGRIEVASPRGAEIDSLKYLEKETISATGYKLPTEATLYSIRPEFGKIGYQMRVHAVVPSGESVPLLHIENREENWQERYYFQEPITLPKEARIVVQTWRGETAGPFDTQGGYRCELEITTPQADHLEPLMRHNQAAISQP